MRLLLLTGFLGSGKTTLLLDLVRRLSPAGTPRFAIIENEAGEVDVDGALLRSQGLQVRELFAGCVCCQLTADLVTTLKALEREVRPDAVIVEASGLAMPGRILETLRRYAKDIEDILVVGIADLERFHIFSEAAEPVIRNQLEEADLVLLNKCDLPVDPAPVRERIAVLNPRAEVLEVSALTGAGLAEAAERIEALWKAA